MSIINSLKNIFSSSDKDAGQFSSIADKKTINKMKKLNKKNISNKNIAIRILDISPNLYLACRAGKICVGRTVDNMPLENRLKFISNITKAGHESITEHTNIIALLVNSNPNMDSDIIELVSNCKFLDVIVRDNHILIGGSIRGYLHAIRETSTENAYVHYLKEILYQSVEKVFLQSLIDKGLLDEDKCTYYPNTIVDMVPSKMTQFKNNQEKSSLENTVTDNMDSISKDLIDPKEEQGIYSDLIYKTDIGSLLEEIKPYGFSLLDAYKVSKITFVFHDISRSCANQLCRHRNGMSQESQRYVTKKYEKYDFVNPVYMQYEEYEGKENTRYSDYSNDKLEDVIDSIDVFKNYNTLRTNKVFKEDARAWLPMNVKTKIMMTFSYWNYAKFLDLRLDAAAQLEIRRVARDSANHIFNNGKELNKFIEDASVYGYQDREVTDIDDSYVVNEEENIKSMNIKDEKTAEEIMSLNEDYKKLGD